MGKTTKAGYWFEGDHVECPPPKRPKKLTGTRFAAVLGLDPWKTPFQVWCEVTRSYEEPFVENIYTQTGKLLEPIIIQYIQDLYFPDLYRPEDVFGPDPFKSTWGDFFKRVPIFGGMWDALSDGENPPECVIEIKTTKRHADWDNGAPDHQALQGALYAYHKGSPTVLMVGALLEDKDYAEIETFLASGSPPEDFQGWRPSDKNVTTDMFDIVDRYPEFDSMIDYATNWWNSHVVTGISPPFDERRDANFLAAMRTNKITPTKNIETLLTEADQLLTEINDHKSLIAPAETRLKEVQELIKKAAIPKFREDDTKVELEGNEYVWIVTKSVRTSIDRNALESDGLLEKYQTVTETYTLRNSKKETNT